MIINSKELLKKLMSHSTNLKQVIIKNGFKHYSHQTREAAVQKEQAHHIDFLATVLGF